MSIKRYLGDGVYYDYDGFSVTLTAEDGISVHDRVVLEPSVLKALIQALCSDLGTDKVLDLMPARMFRGEL